MQQPIVLQSGPFGDGNPPQKSKAESEASQRTHLKPSEAKVGDMFYRFENHIVSIGVDEWDNSLGSRMELYCHEYKVSRVYPKGAYILGWFGGPDDIASKGGRPVMDHYKNKFAYPTKVEALLGFIARKRRQQSILNRQIANSQDAERKAQQRLFHELNA